LGKIDKITFIRQAGILKPQEYGNYDLKIFNGNIVLTWFASLGKISSITPEIVRVATAHFYTK